MCARIAVRVKRWCECERWWRMGNIRRTTALLLDFKVRKTSQACLAWICAVTGKPHAIYMSDVVASLLLKQGHLGLTRAGVSWSRDDADGGCSNPVSSILLFHPAATQPPTPLFTVLHHSASHKSLIRWSLQNKDFTCILCSRYLPIEASVLPTVD